MIQLEPYAPSRCREILDLFYHTVHTVNAQHYNQDQLNAWAPKELNARDWDSRLGNMHTTLAMENGRMIGFGSITREGYLDYLFVHKGRQRQGIAKLLADELESWAVQQGATRLWVHASITAKPFFEKRGYQVIKEQVVELRGQTMTNFVMEQGISSADH